MEACVKKYNISETTKINNRVVGQKTWRPPQTPNGRCLIIQSSYIKIWYLIYTYMYILHSWLVDEIEHVWDKTYGL